MTDEATPAMTMRLQTPFWPWLIAAGFAGWLVWPSAFQAAQALQVIGQETFQLDIFKQNLLTFLMTALRTLGPFVIFWALCLALRQLVSIWRLRISTQIMVAGLITAAALVMLNIVRPYAVISLDGWLFVQMLAFLPATIFGGIFGGMALFILRRMRAKGLFTFVGVGFGVGLMLVVFSNVPAVIATTPISKLIRSTLISVGFWGVGGALALSLVWFWWQTLHILRSQDISHIR